jgi:DHA2 family multidrug resistance protein
LEIFHHARLTESLSTYRPIVSNFYDTMKDSHTSFTNPTMNVLLDRQVEQQAYMLATNDITWLAACLFLAMIPLIYLCKPVKPMAQLIAAH